MKRIILFTLITLSFLIVSCNPDGIGIFFQVSEEVDLNDSNISSSQIFKVLETGGDVYTLAGYSVWKKSSANWSDISGSNYMISIFEYSGSLYSVVNNDLNSFSQGKIMSYDGTSWNLVNEYNSNINILDFDGNYILNKRTSLGNTVGSTTNPSAAISINESLTENIFDGASFGSTDLLISSDNLYGTAIGSLSTMTINPDTAVSGYYRGIASDSGGNFYLSSSSGQIYSSSDNGSTWTLILDISEEPVSGSLGVVTLNSKEYLIIGTGNAYLEMNITDSGSIVTPAETISTADFTATYPDLANELIFKVYQSADGIAGNYFYLATSTGLWKRLSDGTFQRQ